MFSSLTKHSFKLISILKHVKRSKSALYITGDKAHETFSVLTPHLDFDERIKNKDELLKNLKLRNIDINIDEISRMWNFYKHIDSKRDGLEESRNSISMTIRNLSKHGGRFEKKIETLKMHGKMVKDDLRVLKEQIWDVEEKTALKILSIPNLLHDNTPEVDPNIIHTYLDKPEIPDIKSHIDQTDVIEYTSPDCYFLKNDAAKFELASTFYTSDFLLNKNYSQFSNSDFARSVIVEGCGTDYSDKSNVFTIIETDSKQENNRLHLTGSATLTSFMTYFARHSVFPTLLPLKTFAIGRKYEPVKTETKSLLNVSQETTVNIFIATVDDQKEMEKEFDLILKDAIDLYESFNYHFRVCYLPANKLYGWEALRASIQMWSPFCNDYVEIGNLSLVGNYVSKRLLFNYGKGYEVNYPCVISGSLLSVPKMLACLVETNKDLLPEILKKFV